MGVWYQTFISNEINGANHYLSKINNNRPKYINLVFHPIYYAFLISFSHVLSVAASQVCQVLKD
jgi:hypothetical protein